MLPILSYLLASDDNRLAIKVEPLPISSKNSLSPVVPEQTTIVKLQEKVKQYCSFAQLSNPLLERVFQSPLGETKSELAEYIAKCLDMLYEIIHLTEMAQIEEEWVLPLAAPQES